MARIRLTAEEREGMEEALQAYCRNKRAVMRSLRTAERETREVAKNPRHPAIKTAPMYRLVTVRRARRRLRLIEEFKRRAKRGC